MKCGGPASPVDAGNKRGLIGLQLVALRRALLVRDPAACGLGPQAAVAFGAGYEPVTNARVAALVQRA